MPDTDKSGQGEGREVNFIQRLRRSFMAKVKGDSISTTCKTSTVGVVSSARDLGVVMDSRLTMVDHVASVCRPA